MDHVSRILYGYDFDVTSDGYIFYRVNCAGKKAFTIHIVSTEAEPQIDKVVIDDVSLKISSELLLEEAEQTIKEVKFTNVDDYMFKLSCELPYY